MSIELIHGDCLEMGWPVVDLVLADPPYGTTYAKWDTIFDFEKLWPKVWGCCDIGVFFGKEPFSTLLRHSQLKQFKYDWIWQKEKSANFLNAKFQPMLVHEIVSVFAKRKTTFNRQMEQRPLKNKRKNKPRQNTTNETFFIQDFHTEKSVGDSDLKNPTSVKKFNSVRMAKHPTQKPVDLLEYLIKTYTNEGDTVLDFCMGSGSTGVACQNTGRNFIGIEKEKKYYDIACERMAFKG